MTLMSSNTTVYAGSFDIKLIMGTTVKNYFTMGSLSIQQKLDQFTFKF